MSKITANDCVPITCNPKCEGKKNLCLIDIKLIVEDGNVAVKMYSEHVKESVEALGYSVDILPENPALMFISKEV